MNIRILGLGNALMSDGAFGPYVVRVLDAFYEMPPNVHIIDAGAPGRDIAPHLRAGRRRDPRRHGRDRRRRGRHPLVSAGRPAAAARRAAPVSARSGHQQGAARAAAAGSVPEHVVLFGVVPEWEATGVTLSRAVRSSIAPVVGLIVAELERLGAAPVRACRAARARHVVGARRRSAGGRRYGA